MPNLKYSALSVSEILSGPNISKLGHMIPSNPFWRHFAFFLLVLTVIYLYAEFEVSNFIRPRDIRGIAKFQK